MSNNRLHLGEPDRSKIDLSSDDEAGYWSKHFGVSRDELQRVVEKVGNSAAAVQKQLSNAART